MEDFGAYCFYPANYLARVVATILTGPYNTNSEEIAQLLIARGAAEVVRDAAGLRARVSALLADPAARARIGAAGRACVDSNRGALDKLLALIEPLLDESEA